MTLGLKKNWQQVAKRILLYHLKFIGVFHLCRFYFSHRTRILCYHGFNVKDESTWNPGTFIRKEVFESRIRQLRRLGATFISLDNVLEPQKHKLPVVLTFDDGFASTIEQGLPILKKHKIPATLYVISNYQQTGTPIFEHHFRYILWKSGTPPSLNWDEIGIETPWKGVEKIASQERVWQIIQYFELEKTAKERVAFMAAIEKIVGCALSKKQLEDSFTLASDAQLHASQAAKLDVQLHTHRHIFPFDTEGCRYEIDQNRAVLKNFQPGKLHHFCYPKGIYPKSQLHLLETLGIKTATTLRPGIVGKDDNPLELPRILDSGEAISDIEFEAHVCGVSDLLRFFKNALLPFGEKHGGAQDVAI